MPFRKADWWCFAISVVLIVGLAARLAQLKDPELSLGFPRFRMSVVLVELLFCPVFLWRTPEKPFLEVYEKEILPFLVKQGTLCMPVAVLIVGI